MLEKRDFYINGKWVAPIEGKDHNVIDPSTEEPCAVISLGGKADADAAVAAAKAALPGWMATPAEERIALVEKLVEVYKARADDLAAAMSTEMGAPISMSKTSQVGSGTWHLSNFIAAAKKFDFVRPLGDHAPNDRIIYEAVGVAALITPWNWPMNQVTLKVGAAAIAGCTMVLKPSEESPLNAMIFAEMMDEAGFPAGVFNLVNGDGAGVGNTLTGHKDVDMVSFTGSTRAGTLISKNAADTLKRVHLELGGKGANLIFDDADDKAVKRGVLHMMNNTGQSCNAPSRMLVQRGVYDRAVEEAAAVANQVTVGPASEEGKHIGPVVNEVQWNKIQDLIQKGIDEGARLIAGGTGRPEGMNRGFYVKPTVFADVNPDMTIAREEIFGPVLSIIPFDTEEEAVEIANDTVYGLTNYVQTQDGTRANRLAKQLRSGMVEMNGTSRAAGSPFGGMKQSGNGREGGVWGIEDFLEVKAVSGWAAE
ncbi:aldehyde dehydrogenase family protein [Sulfitobacter pseudonitzschiae]|uniref:Aldehyde dehydrogenase family protein n=1 Tax=Pseudosulfitobacter pseudonitzschiae TaxID=1402135 RepID=A0A9Q2NXQ1_9RHOB|nr:aldehyde dehydrogenase family protein [Pseudosulfitobacter pseudonitzschiae]MBM2290363.1 aldehyde dehydrogenase family protein [Pseudosulfitobacter pseudonitzschiae]MBM2295281.1 aldehyde dehydrogenase family protein [Pseudosulfitobacter pseudonitzschiae]MBM2300193.1 aldehyde dehydrogenase family protein [Pseudosulfitobacter pseudonitzschiae]MBM2309978.1 aldehyde dehydrogenase family protein [Pseudosulfitobacter pseudonitzschiae]MBM2314890.1 aldehyde dehydrogenase family protein [Pseudosulfi